MISGLLFFMVCTIICGKELIVLEDKVFSIIHDRRIFKIKCENKLDQNEVSLSADFFYYNEEVFTILFDRFFPNFFHYDINLGELKRRYGISYFIITCYTKEEKILFEFQVECNLNNILVSDFYSAEKGTVFAKKYKNQQFDAYIICSQENNFASIRNSLDYIETVESYDSFLAKLLNLKIICLDRQEESSLGDILNLEVFDPSFLINSRKIKSGIVNVFYSCHYNFKSLVIPRSNKLEYFKFFELVEKKLTDLFDDLLVLLKSSESNIKKSKKINGSFKKYLLSLFDTRIKTINMKIDLLKENFVKEAFYKIQGDINLLDAFVKKIVDNGNSNIQIINDCEIRNIDRFIHSFSSILIEYCEICECLNLNDPTNSFFFELHEINDEYLNSFDLHIDIFFAKEMKKYLLNYQYDKTDFLIFSETYYFKIKLASKIEKILKNLIMVFDLKKKQNKIPGYRFDFSEKDSIFYNKISNLKVKWNIAFASFGRFEPLSFACILNHLSEEAEKSEKEIKEDITMCVNTIEEQESNFNSYIKNNDLNLKPNKENIEEKSINKLQNDSSSINQGNTTIPETDNINIEYESNNQLSVKERHFVECKADDSKNDKERKISDIKIRVPVDNDSSASFIKKKEEVLNFKELQGLIENSNNFLNNLNKNSVVEKETQTDNNEKEEERGENTEDKILENKTKKVKEKDQKNHAKPLIYIVILVVSTSMLCLILYFSFIKP